MINCLCDSGKTFFVKLIAVPRIGDYISPSHNDNMYEVTQVIWINESKDVKLIVKEMS